MIDGEILPWSDGAPLPFAQLQRRIGRKTLGRKILAEVPVVLVAYDLLEERRRRTSATGRSTSGASGWRRCSRDRRRPAGSLLSPRGRGARWADARRGPRRTRARRGAEGLMLKRRLSAYGVGRRRGDWWKWKVDPSLVDAVLIYAQPGSGRRASLYTDYTFGVWDGDRLVPFAKAYSGLTDEEIRRGGRLRPPQHAREVRPGAHRASPSSSSSWPSRASSARPATSRASRCGSRGWRGGGPTSGPRRPTRWRRSAALIEEEGRSEEERG